MLRFSFFLVLISLVFFASISMAGIPKMINYQGMLTDNSGNPLSGSYNLTFKIWTDTTGGSTLWTETQSGVEVQNGLFNVILGRVITLNLAFNQPYWLEVGVGGETTPRIRFTSVGYAYRAQVADTALAAISAGSGGGWTDDGTNVRLTTGSDKVGIGIATPDRTLDVNGQISLRPGALSNAGIHLKTLAGADEWFMGKTNIGGKNQLGFYKDDWRFVIEDSGDVGIGTVDPHEMVEIYRDQNDWPTLRINNPSGGDYAGSAIVFQEGENYRAFIGAANSGNTAAIAGAKSLAIETSDGPIRIATPAGYPVCIMTGGGNVGIGTSSPGCALHVRSPSSYFGMLRLQNFYTGNNEATMGFIGGSEVGHETWLAGVGAWSTGRDFVIGLNSAKLVITAADGNVGIGTTGPGYKLDVAGQAHATSFPTSSDVRLKKNVHQLTGVLEKLEDIRGVSFDWNEKYESMGRSTGHREIGVIAQEVEVVFPELVTTWGKEEYRAVDYGRLTGVLIEAIKELKVENEGLKKRIQVLEAR